MGLGYQSVPVEQWVAERKVIEAAKALYKKMGREHASYHEEVACVCHAVEALQAQEGE
jgi:hypothetical protein